MSSALAGMSSSSSQETTSTGTSFSSQPSSASSISSADDSSTPSSVPTSSTQRNTSSSPATTPTTTPQSTPAQTSSPATQTTSSSSSGSTSFTSTATPTTSQSLLTSQLTTTFSSTNAAGSVVYVTSIVPDVITTSIGSGTGGGGSSSSNSHTGVIVGAVVGGVAGTILLALLFFCIRRRVRKDDFDGNFDPDRVVGHTDRGGGTLPNVDLAEDVTPFPQPYTDQGSSSMRQYGESPYIAASSSLAPSGPASTEFYPPGSGTSASGAYLPPIDMYGSGAMDWHSPHLGSQNVTSTKEREAMGRNGQRSGPGSTTRPEGAEGSDDVVVHRDAGRAPAEEHVPPREIPPAYESIPQD